MSTRQSFLRSRILSIRFAVDGVRALVATQPNARIHLVATVLVIGAGLVLDVGRSDWIALTLAMAFVWLAEALNTAVECLGDAITREPHPLSHSTRNLPHARARTSGRSSTRLPPASAGA